MGWRVGGSQQRHRRAPRLVAVVALVLGVTLVVGGGSPAGARRTAAPADASAPRSALFVGDSIMRSIVGELQIRLVDRPAGLATTFVASGGMGIDDSTYAGPRITSATATTGGFDAIVINLGANDVLEGYVTTNRSTHMNRLLDAAGTTPVLWLNQAETLPKRAAAAAFNADLVAAVATHPNARIVDWRAVLDAHHEYLDPDNLHLNAQGQAAMAQVVADALDALP